MLLMLILFFLPTSCCRISDLSVEQVVKSKGTNLKPFMDLFVVFISSCFGFLIPVLGTFALIHSPLWEFPLC